MTIVSRMFASSVSSNLFRFSALRCDRRRQRSSPIARVDSMPVSGCEKPCELAPTNHRGAWSQGRRSQAARVLTIARSGSPKATRAAEHPLETYDRGRVRSRCLVPRGTARLAVDDRERDHTPSTADVRERETRTCRVRWSAIATVTVRRHTDDVTNEEQLRAAVAEVDESLLDWYLSLSIVERLRAASRSAAVLERMARVASRNR